MLPTAEQQDRMIKYQRMMQERAQKHFDAMVEKYGEKYRRAVAVRSEGSAGTVVGYSIKSGVIDVCDDSGKVHQFNALEHFGIPAHEFHIGERVTSVPAPQP